MARDLSDVMTDQISIKLALRSAEKLKGHHQEDDTDTAASEGSIGSDMPGFGEKACVDGIPVPQHLAARLASVLQYKDIGVGTFIFKSEPTYRDLARRPRTHSHSHSSHT